MANQNITIPIGKMSSFIPKAFDGPNGTGNDITALCTFTVTSSDVTTASVVGPPVSASGYQIRGLKLGTATITRTATNDSGSETETDTITVPEAAPVSQTAPYSTPQ
jgi:uncharacterized protein YjdB